MTWGKAFVVVVVLIGSLGVVAPAGASSGAAYSPARAGCTITGTRGSDVLRGTPHTDVICGGRGDDTLRGIGGPDVLLGGPGADVLKGGGGADRLLGSDGSDRLFGNDGTDSLFGGGAGDDLYDSNGRLNGGSGVDYCPWDAHNTACETWAATDTVLVGTNLPTSIELTGATRTVRARIHLRDPLGVETTDLYLSREPSADNTSADNTSADNTGVYSRLRLGSGTRRDGWWVGALELPGHQPSGGYSFAIYTQGRFAGPSGTFDLPATIANSASDDAPPLLTTTSGIAPGQELPVSRPAVLEVEVSDDLAGARDVSVRWYNTSTRDYVETDAQRTGGSALTGTWQATLQRPRRIGAGPAEFAVTVIDKAGNRQQYSGPWQMDWLSAVSYLMLPIPEDAGPFELVP